jgi:23S rRNA (cytidine1920-2'-O)/16S rRNA (cytidine1409-2'-O)-methyltransferase
LACDGRLIVLIKPQFEVGRGEVGGGGIVRDSARRTRVVEEVNQAAVSFGLENLGVIESPIRGGEGNVEFLGLYKLSVSDKP